LPGLAPPIAPAGRPAIHTPRIALRDALLVLAICAAVGAAVNALRPGGIPFVQKTEYQILVPCPEGLGEIEAIGAGDPALRDTRTLLVDARASAEHQRWHPAGAISVPFDYLEPVSSAGVKRIAASGASRVVVFGDGGSPDSGEQLGRELAGKGIRNVRFVPGGVARLQDPSVAGGQR
jgi:hypothetical protein